MRSHQVTREMKKNWNRNALLYEDLRQKRGRIDEQRRARAPWTLVVAMMDKILQRDDETFAPSGSSIRVQPASRLFLARIRKTPRWQPRGHDTQSFRPLVQEELVSSRARVLVRPMRVNYL